jgi:hypothetical protein
MARAIVIGVVGAFVLVLAGIATILAPLALPGTCTPDPNVAGQSDCSPAMWTIYLGIGLMLLGLLFAAAYIGGAQARVRAERERIERDGLPGTARILSFQPTGSTSPSEFGESSGVEMVLEVTVEDRPAYRVSHQEQVPQLVFGRLTDGRPVPVRVDRDRPDRLIIDWRADTPALEKK